MLCKVTHFTWHVFANTRLLKWVWLTQQCKQDTTYSCVASNCNYTIAINKVYIEVQTFLL